MATQTSTSSTTTTTATTVQQEQQQAFKLTERIVPWKVPKLAGKHETQDSDGNHITATFSLFKIIGLSAPPLVIPGTLLLLAVYREIPAEDHAFSIGFALYLCLANKFRFNKNAKQIALRKSRGEAHPEKPEWFLAADGTWFDKYMASAAVLGLVLPLLVQIFAPSPMAQAAAPHLYVLLFQILMEIMGNGPSFHPMLQVAVPIGYSAYRMASLKAWLSVAWQLMDGRGGGGTAWAAAHFGLALINAVFWTYNTFVMLLLRVLPPCLDGEKFPDAGVSWKYHLVPVAVNETNGTLSKTRAD